MKRFKRIVLISLLLVSTLVFISCDLINTNKEEYYDKATDTRLAESLVE